MRMAHIEFCERNPPVLWLYGGNSQYMNSCRAWILADDLGYADVGCYGQKIIQTPNIDRIAAEGIRFTQAYAGDTVCAPSRCALMTGMHSGHGRIRGNKKDIFLEQSDVTVATFLKQAGYRTGIF